MIIKILQVTPTRWFFGLLGIDYLYPYNQEKKSVKFRWVAKPWDLKLQHIGSLD